MFVANVKMAHRVAELGRRSAAQSRQLQTEYFERIRALMAEGAI